MRLIDADALIEEMKKEQESGKYDENTIIVSDCFIGILNRQPTAYNVEKVIAQIEEEKFGRCDDSKRVLGYAQEYVRKGGVE